MHHFGRACCAILGMLLPAFEAHATSIVILRSVNKVYIGADSRRSYRDARGSYPSSVCKIVPAGRFLFVASGLTYANHQDVADLGIQAGLASATVEQALEEFRTRVARFLPEALAAREQVEASTRDGLVLEAAFVGMENDVAKVSVEWFRAGGNPANPIVATDRQSYSSRSGGYDFIFLGRRQSIDRYLDGRTRPIRSDNEAAEMIRRLIGLEIADSPNTTASPIDILRVTQYGRRWLAGKSGCEVTAAN